MKKDTKPKIAIYDFTDCEGCEVEIVSLREKLLLLERRVDIIDWRLGQESKSLDPARDKEKFDITLIEGTPITQDEIDTLKYLRENSACIIAFGACASLAGIPGIMKKEEREKWYKAIYPLTNPGQPYKPKGIDALPLQSYVKVDFFIHGCPVNKDEVVRIFEELLSGRVPVYRPYSVCFECKQAGNKCRIISGKPCLGPIARGGCKAVCVSGGSPCYACMGAREEAEIENLVKVLKNLTNKEEIERYFSMFHNQMPDWNEKAKNELQK